MWRKQKTFITTYFCWKPCPWYCAYVLVWVWAVVALTVAFLLKTGLGTSSHSCRSRNSGLMHHSLSDDTVLAYTLHTDHISQPDWIWPEKEISYHFWNKFWKQLESMKEQLILSLLLFLQLKETNIHKLIFLHNNQLSNVLLKENLYDVLLLLLLVFLKHKITTTAITTTTATTTTSNNNNDMESCSCTFLYNQLTVWQTLNIQDHVARVHNGNNKSHIFTKWCNGTAHLSIQTKVEFAHFFFFF